MGDVGPLDRPQDTSVLSEPLCSLCGVDKWYGSSRVLRDVDLDIYRGDVTVIIGPSGSGKSTLLRTINMLERPTRGQVILDGVEISDIRANLNAARRKMGMVFQSFNLFPHMSVMDNVSLGLRVVLHLKPESARERAVAGLERVGLADKAKAYPSQLSGGQCQRVAVARALVMDPELMLFDEVTSSLDPELVKEVLETMKGLASSGMTMVVVTHEIGFARQVATRVIFMEEGRIVVSGSPADVLERPQNDRCRVFLGSVL